MTKEEAIKRIEEGAPFDELYDREWEEALSMAIKALEQQPTKEEKALLQKWRDNRGISMKDFEDAMDALEKKPCEDAISRKEVLDILRAEWVLDKPIEEWSVYRDVVDLPSVAPMPKENVLETIHEEIQKEKEGITFNLNEEKARWTNGGIYDGLTWAQEIIDKYKDKGAEE